MRHYMELLPNYLGGPNIEAHADIMDKSNLYLNDLFGLLSLWNTLERPILIEKNATTLFDITMNVHIHVSSPIKKISITGDYTYTMEYLESDSVLEDTISFEAVGYRDTITNPYIVVSVETYDEVTYMKAYPENDTLENNVHDHDEFLDKMGTLLGISRRTYVPYNWSYGNLAEPQYFGKKIINEVVQACTEDDYYYFQRLNYFLENKKRDVLYALIKAKYNKNVLIVSGDDVRLEDFEQTFPEFVEEHDITEEWIEDNKYGTYLTYLDANEVPINWGNIVSDELLNDIKNLMPITRLCLIREMRILNPTARILSTRNGFYTAEIELDFQGWYNLPFTVAFNNSYWHDRFFDAVTGRDGKWKYKYYGKKNVEVEEIVVHIKTEGVHGESQVDVNIPLTIRYYTVENTEVYTSLEEHVYTYSSRILPEDGLVERGSSYISNLTGWR